jgi:hypothetical protein
MRRADCSVFQATMLPYGCSNGLNHDCSEIETIAPPPGARCARRGRWRRGRGRLRIVDHGPDRCDNDLGHGDGDADPGFNGTGQIAFPETVSSAVYATGVYAAHGQNTQTTNANDNVFSDGVTNELAQIADFEF